MKKSGNIYIKIIATASGFAIAAAIVYGLMIAQHLMVPFVFAFLLWYLINTAEKALGRVRLKGFSMPRWLRIFIALVILAMAFNLVAEILATNVTRIIDSAPSYQRNLERLLMDLPFGMEPEEIPALTWITQEFNIGRFMQRAAMEFAGILGNLGLILIYLIFLFLEQRYFDTKLQMASSSKKKYRFVKEILSEVDKDIRRYVGVKTLLSLATAAGSWLIMRGVGLEFASFWALLIFIFNFIPNIGSLIATIMPVILALLQFETTRPALIIFLGVGALQFTIGNFIDPALLGKSLNVSPLAIILSLVFWGTIWKIPGMFLSVPITVIIIIILNSFDRTRWVAQMLSKDGSLKSLHTS